MSQPSQPGDRASQLEKVVRGLKPPAASAHLPVLPDRSDRLLSVLEATRAWVTEFDDQGRVVYASPNVELVLGFTPEELLASDCLEFHADDLPQLLEVGRIVRSTGKLATNETRLRHKQGHWVWVRNSLLGWYTDAGEFHTIGLARDITELKNAESARRESEDRYRVVSQMSCDLIIEVAAGGQLTYIGPGAMEILGYTAEEILAFEPWALVHPDDVERLRGQLETEFAGRAASEDVAHGRATVGQRMEYRGKHRDGRWLWFETLGTTYRRADGELSYLAVTRDVTDVKLAEQARREMEESLQRAQKLESLGVLAGGIAHDFNNLLTPILGAAGLALSELPEDSPTRVRLDTIQQAALRAAALTNQMLAYAGERPLLIEQLDLSTLVIEMQELVAASISGKTSFDLELEPGLPFIEGEAAQISQLVMNLVTNASESLRDGTGRITVRTGVVEMETPHASALFAETMASGRLVYFEVSDEGCGMDAETRARIFEPFYTTKFTGRGLGLAAVAGIVRAHRGAIEVESEPGLGARFRVLFPAATATHVAHEAPASQIESWRASGLALVVDDDEAVRELTADVLSRAGMEVLTASDGIEGLRMFDTHSDRVRVVLLDRTMPRLSGTDTFDAIRKVREDARIIMVSGYTEERATSELLDRGLAGFLMKPFTPATLLERVRKVLDGPPS